MRWFRRNKVFGAQAALFALLIQFALAFGHVHAVETGHGTAAPVATLNFATDGQSAPASPDHGIPSDEICAICTTIHLTGSAQVAAAPSMPVPVAYPVAKFSLSSETFLDDQHCLELRSRGPPQA